MMCFILSFLSELHIMHELSGNASYLSCLQGKLSVRVLYWIDLKWKSDCEPSPIHVF